MSCNPCTACRHMLGVCTAVALTSRPAKGTPGGSVGPPPLQSFRTSLAVSSARPFGDPAPADLLLQLPDLSRRRSPSRIHPSRSCVGHGSTPNIPSPCPRRRCSDAIGAAVGHSASGWEATLAGIRRTRCKSYKGISKVQNFLKACEYLADTVGPLRVCSIS